MAVTRRPRPHPAHRPALPGVSVAKRVLLGRPLASAEAHHERLRKLVALPVFSADAIASSAFATEEILRVLVPAVGMAAIGYLVPISLVVVVLLVIVVTSYRQTIFAYPNGGGSYIVSRDNLGTNASLVAGASLMVDYTLTVAVSIAAGTAAIVSAIAPLRGHRVGVAVALTLLLALANLRGLRESGRLFAGPTYIYIAVLGALIVWGLIRYATGSIHALPVDQANLDLVTGDAALATGASAFLLARAFSSGAVALSGVEAISNGIPAFRPPESRNAATTLTWTGTILAVLFFGVAVLTARLRPTLSPDQTILSIMGHEVFGSGPMYWLLQAATAGILVLSANTAFADFPRLSSIVARDGFLPRQLYARGDRLVFSNGIIALTTGAVILLVAFSGSVTQLIPLFAVGLFASFTLSQAGMVVHHHRLREQGWRRGLAVNAVGATATFAVLVVVVVSKFGEGAWIPAVVIPLIVVVFKAVHRHYATLAQAVALPPGAEAVALRHAVVVLVGRLHRGVPVAVAYAKSLRPEHLVAVTVATDDIDPDDLRAEWDAHRLDIPLEVVESPYRELSEPILAFLDELDDRWADDTITVVIPEVVVHRWYQHLLHNQSALALKSRLLYRENTVVTSVPWHYEPGEDEVREPGGIVVHNHGGDSGDGQQPPAGDERQVE
ncbi:MAG TPA: APC family permease [Acidimicrobiales bacterium]|nr:APC family permease [Acidimicrobiales bacterium]